MEGLRSLYYLCSFFVVILFLELSNATQYGLSLNGENYLTACEDFACFHFSRLLFKSHAAHNFTSHIKANTESLFSIECWVKIPRQGHNDGSAVFQNGIITLASSEGDTKSGWQLSVNSRNQFSFTVQTTQGEAKASSQSSFENVQS